MLILRGGGESAAIGEIFIEAADARDGSKDVAASQLGGADTGGKPCNIVDRVCRARNPGIGDFDGVRTAQFKFYNFAPFLAAMVVYLELSFIRFFNSGFDF